MNDMKRTGHKRIYLFAVTVLAVLSVLSVLAGSGLYLSHTNTSSTKAALGFTSSDWSSWASTAWKYYTPGVGVNSATGLHRANLAWDCFTDWDLGTYIYSVIYARKLGLITDGTGSGDWQFKDRIDKVLSFLQNRPLNVTGGNMSYLAYDWSGTACSDTGSQPTVASDSGRLLAALYALENSDSTYKATVNAIFTRSKSAYDSLVSQVGKYDYYGYLVAEGFAAFGYDVSASFANIDNYSGPYVTVYGQSLPIKGTVAEPIDHVLLEGDTLVHPPSSNFLNFAGRVELAQAGRYSALGKLTAWSEGSYSPNPYYIYEVVLENATLTWFLTGGATVPLAYTKVAFTYLAVYGESAYTLALVNAAKNLASSSYGFGEATYENGQSAIGAWRNPLGFYSDKTNEFILAAANYAINHPTTSSSSSTGRVSSMVSSMSQTVETSLERVSGPGALSPATLTGTGLCARLSVRLSSGLEKTEPAKLRVGVVDYSSQLI